MNYDIWFKEFSPQLRDRFNDEMRTSSRPSNSSEWILEQYFIWCAEYGVSPSMTPNARDAMRYYPDKYAGRRSYLPGRMYSSSNASAIHNPGIYIGEEVSCMHRKISRLEKELEIEKFKAEKKSFTPESTSKMIKEVKSYSKIKLLTLKKLNNEYKKR